jgi:polysaccharide biosynthesis protein PslG
MRHSNYHRLLIAAATIALVASVSLLLLGFAGNKTDGKRQPIGKVAPLNALQISNSPWGIQIGSLEKDHLAKAAAIGVKWTRLNGSWREIEKKLGVYDWTKSDQAYAAALESGITPFICLEGSNPLYCKPSDEIDPRQIEIYGSSIAPPTKDPRAMEGWLKFVRAAVQRYKATIKYWEIWNEPNHVHYWGAPPDGTEYGLLVRKTAEVIKEADPSAKVIAGALAGLDPDFTDKFLGNGAAKLIDIITFHNYGELPEERIYKALEVWDVINKHNRNLELWQGECGYPSHSSTRDYRGSSPWGVLIQAKWLLRQSFTDVFFCKTTLSNYFKLVHPGGRGEKPQRSFLTSIDSVLGFPARGGSRVKSVGINEKCVLENATLEPKPAYFAYQNLCAVFDGRYSRTTLTSKVSIDDPGIFYGIGESDDAFPSKPLVSTFKTRNDHYLVAYWLPWHAQEIIREATITLKVQGAQFKNPVLIDLLSGQVYNIQMSAGKGNETLFTGIPLADYPFVIAEKEELHVN